MSWQIRVNLVCQLSGRDRAYTIHAFEEWKNHNVTHWNNPIIDQLFLMGCPDWTGVDNHMVLGIQVMRFGTVVLSQVIPLIHVLEDKVPLPSLLFCC